MHLTDAQHDLVAGLVSAHILDLNGQLQRRPDLTDAGRASYHRQREEAYATLQALARLRAREALAA
jgi:hypothetical protein